MTAPTVDDIPKAADLQRQLDTLNQAIALLSMPGASIGGVLCNPGPEPEPPAPPAGEPPAPDLEAPMLGPVMVKLVPPLDDPPVINTLINTINRHATAIEKELADMGYVGYAAG